MSLRLTCKLSYPLIYFKLISDMQPSNTKDVQRCDCKIYWFGVAKKRVKYFSSNLWFSNFIFLTPATFHFDSLVSFYFLFVSLSLTPLISIMLSLSSYSLHFYSEWTSEYLTNPSRDFCQWRSGRMLITKTQQAWPELRKRFKKINHKWWYLKTLKWKLIRHVRDRVVSCKGRMFVSL